jgi:asparagine synthase (glutamine-hydrolysing)
MFAIAVWDRPARTLLLARDRAGIKPLHYAERDGRLYFGSEIKCLLAAGAVSRELDPQALDHYLALLYAPGDRAMFKGVRKLPPGHYLRWRVGRLDVCQYWQIPETETFRGSEEDAAVELKAVLSDAVRSHLMSDVPLGAFLSGGVDSSLVVGLMAQASERPVKTFSIGFDEPQFDELEHARRVAAHFRTDHHEFVVRPEGLAILDRLVEHFDEPFADSSAIPTWYVSEMARRHVTVVLSGDGGDELFGGYDRYFPHPNVERFDRLPIPGRRALAAGLWPRLPHGAYGRNLLRHVGLDADGRYLDSLVFFHADERRALYSEDLVDELTGSPAERVLAARLGRFRDLPSRSRMMRLDFETYLPEDVLTKVDRMSMAHSIESRVPLLDNRVVDFAATVPARMKLANGRQKHLLKEVAASILPPGIVDRRKQGFGVPLGVWFRGGLTNFLREVLTAPRTRQRGYFSPAFVDRLVREHVGGRRDHTLRLWQLLVFELWHRRYLDTAEPSMSEAEHPTRAARYPLMSSAP